MTKTELARLAAAINVLRPDWPIPSLQTFLTNGHHHRPLRDVAVALTWIATDPDTQSPGRLNEPGPWWSASRTADTPQVVNDCPRHPETGLRVDPVTGRTSCAGCWVDDHEADEPGRIDDRGGKPIPDQAREAIEQVIRRPETTAGEAPTGERDPMSPVTAEAGDAAAC